MDRYTNYSDGQKDVPRSRLVSSIPRPKSPLSAGAPYQSHRGNSPQRRINEKALSERYTNYAYERVPSPKDRFQALASGRRVTSARNKSHASDSIRKAFVDQTPTQVPIPKPRERIQMLPLKTSQSDMNNAKRLLEVECEEQTSLQRTRPMTDSSRPESSNFEYKVLSAVKRVLSRAVFLEGKIDENNMDAILTNMRNVLNFDEDNSEEEAADSQLQSYLIRETDVKRSVSPPLKIGKPLPGIVRKPESPKPQKPYLRIYSPVDNNLNNVPVKNQRSRGDTDDTLVCIDLPESKIFSFPMKEEKEEKEEKECKRKEPSNMTVFKNDLSIKYSQKDVFLHNSKQSQENRVGDFQSRESNHFWSSSEDEKLRSYIESMVKNMRNQLRCEGSPKEIVDEIDSDGTVCKSFCICKVCVSNKSASKHTITISNHSLEAEEPKPAEMVMRRPIRCETRNKVSVNTQPDRISAQRTARQRLQKLPTKRSTGNIATFPKNNPEVKHGLPAKNSTYSPADNENTENVSSDNCSETTDDMYLQRRRRRKSVVRSAGNR